MKSCRKKTGIRPLQYKSQFVEGRQLFRYAHTNIIARDCWKLIDFYKKVLGCRSINEKRDQQGEWLDRLTGLTAAHIVGCSGLALKIM